MLRRSAARVRILEADVGQPLEDIHGLDDHSSARVLVRRRGRPIAFVRVGIRDGVCRAADILAALPDDAGSTDEAASDTPLAGEGRLPTLTVAVCTRDRPEELEGCLDALRRVDYPGLDVLVVDNAPSDDRTARLCGAFAGVRYRVEPRPGLDWARNRAILESASEILAFTDDDARPDPDWARRLVEPFLENPRIMAVAGLVIPLELETDAQVMFEEYGGLSGGIDPIRLVPAPDWGVRGLWHCALMAPHGSGANMAFRRSAFDAVGVFDPALDVGTPTGGGGDTEMLFRVLANGYGMAYEPRAIVRHRHRRDEAGLRRQITGWGSGFTAVLLRGMHTWPRGAWVLALVGLRGLLQQGLRLIRPGPLSRGLVLAELRGVAAGPWRYVSARRRAAEIARRFGPQDAATATPAPRHDAGNAPSM